MSMWMWLWFQIFQETIFRVNLAEFISGCDIAFRVDFSIKLCVLKYVLDG